MIRKEAGWERGVCGGILFLTLTLTETFAGFVFLPIFHHDLVFITMRETTHGVSSLTRPRYRCGSRLFSFPVFHQFSLTRNHFQFRTELYSLIAHSTNLMIQEVSPEGEETRILDRGDGYKRF